MDDTSTPLLLIDGGKGARISPPSEATRHEASSSKTSPGEIQVDEVANQSVRHERKAQDPTTPSPVKQVTPEDGDGDRSSLIAAAKTRMFFPSARFPFSLSLKKSPPSGETPLDGDCADLIEGLEHLLRDCSGSSYVISDPTSRLIAAARSLATVDVADSKARKEAQFELLLASTALTMVASREKVEEGIATTAKNLASQAARLLAKSGGLKQRNGRSSDFLFCLTISGALALLPYLSTEIPESIQPFISVGFGVVFFTASVGTILSFKATHHTDLTLADCLNTLSFGVFCLLATVFVCSALASGNITLIVICALVMFLGHVYAWTRS